jgi:hypothetical protein
MEAGSKERMGLQVGEITISEKGISTVVMNMRAIIPEAMIPTMQPRKIAPIKVERDSKSVTFNIQDF